MDNRLLKIMLGVIGALAIVIVAGLLIRMNRDDTEKVNTQDRKSVV